MMADSGLFQRLKERKLVQWALAYVAGAWVFYEAASTIGGHFGVSDFLFRGLFILLAAGFLGALVVAWYHGEKGQQRISGAELLLLAAVLGLGGWGVSRLDPKAPGVESSVPSEDSRDPSILVLKFRNLSPDPDDAFFAGGLQEALTSKLDHVSSLVVKSRATADWYAARAEPPPLPQFARDFQIDYFVDGSVRRSGDSIRITVQLIDGAADRQLWARDYDAGYSVEGYVRLQSQIVQQIASDLRGPISPEDMAWLEDIPTRDLGAFEAFERGLESYWEVERYGGLSLPVYPSTGLFEQAVALDPDFARAHAWLARSLLLRHLGPDPGRHERARLEAERSLALAPDLADGHLAMSSYYQAIGEQEKALQSLRLALENTWRAPDSLEILYTMALWAGEREQTTETLREWGRVDPANPWVFRWLYDQYLPAHRYQEALEALRREAVLLDGPSGLNLLSRMMVHLLRGEPDRALALHEDFLATHSHNYSLLPGSRYVAVLRFLPPEYRQREWNVRLMRLEGRIPGVAPSTPRPCDYAEDPISTCIRTAIHERDTGSPDMARVLWDSLRVAAETVWPEPDLPEEYYARAMLYMELGQEDEALRWARAARERYAPGPCSLDESLARRHDSCMMLARVLARFGRHDEALDIVEELLPAPSYLTAHMLQLDPAWKDLWGHPRFERILVDYADMVEVAPGGGGPG